MSRDRDDKPRTAAKVVVQQAGPKPRNKECMFQRGDGSADWPNTEKDFPIRRKGDR